LLLLSTNFQFCVSPGSYEVKLVSCQAGSPIFFPMVFKEILKIVNTELCYIINQTLTIHYLIIGECLQRWDTMRIVDILRLYCINYGIIRIGGINISIFKGQATNWKSCARCGGVDSRAVDSRSRRPDRNSPDKCSTRERHAVYLMSTELVARSGHGRYFSFNLGRSQFIPVSTLFNVAGEIYR